jgi:hypothetical protein
MGLFDKVRERLQGGDDELGREDLLRQVEEGILALKRFGKRGKEVFPPGVRVRVTTREAGVVTLRGFVEDPSFEHDLEARLLNRLATPDALPARRYAVAAGEENRVVVEEDAIALQGTFVVEGGDHAGDRFPVELTRREWRVGRGRWHQERPDDQRLPNDIVLTESLPFVSRAAALIRRSGAFLEVEARQQGEFLVVVRRDGTQLRPALTAAGRLPFGVGDRARTRRGGPRMLKREAPDRFRVDFTRVPRPERSTLRRFLRSADPVLVDAWAIAQAVSAVLEACPFRSATGAPQVWNEYRVFLARADHDRLRPVESTLHAELGPLLYQKLVEMKAVTVGAITIRLLVDDADEVDEGSATLHARHVPDAAAVPGAKGEITVRLDKLPTAAPAATTMRVGRARLVTPQGELVLGDGARYVLGRAHPGAGEDHLALPGASGRINRRQLAVRLVEEGLEVSREPGDSNPVAVNGQALAPGHAVTVRLPAEITLSGGDLVVTARPC